MVTSASSSDHASALDPVRVGIVGAGFAAGLHLRAYRQCGAPRAEVVGIAGGRSERARKLAAEYGVPNAYDDYRRLLDRPDVDVVDLCTPNNLHHQMALDALAAGKHLIVEKPLTGYFGGPGAAEPVGRTSKALMLREALGSADAILAAAEKAAVKLMYAENFVYAPSVAKARHLIAESGSPLLEIRAQECHSGSHAAYAKRWREAGGGALLRLGAHPIGLALHLKRWQGERTSGKPIDLRSVSCEAADLTRLDAFRAQEKKWLVHDWEDVENWAAATLTFEDGSRAVCVASDTVLGGMEDTVQLYLSNARINCNFTHSNTLQVYAAEHAVFPGEPLQEKLTSNAGWSYPPIDNEYMLGYAAEIQDFVSAVALDRAPLSDGHLGRAVVEAIYGAYQSAEEGRRVTVPSAL
ncbi:MAG TPA: Gfo/Idh/MocA family oxidoreductase [Chloroflexota bacterium]|nr:Gfo/Idh/MocA family oxidoreductase [Chloroflexota bacterium]